MSRPLLSRRAFALTAAISAAAAALPQRAFAQSAFEQWVAQFRARALAKGVSAATYDRVMRITPDTSVYAAQRAQPEFNEQLWQYLYRRVSDWRISTGKERAREFAALFARIERDFGVAPATLLGLWGIESAFGDPLVQANHMRPVIPALAALAFGEPRRKAYWETELINALRIIEKGWATPQEMKGSWAGAMGHTQWMPEVWLNIGMDYDGDNRVNPFGRPDDALASSARYLVQRGRYRRGEPWGYEVRAPNASSSDASKSFAAWQAQGVARADGAAYPLPEVNGKLWVPVAGGPAFLLAHNFNAVKTYNPSNNYTLAIVHLGDRLTGGGPLRQLFPGAEERVPTLAEIQEIQKRLTAMGFDTGGSDGRVGGQTMTAIGAFQRKVGMPADGYAGLKVLARLRQG